MARDSSTGSGGMRTPLVEQARAQVDVGIEAPRSVLRVDDDNRVADLGAGDRVGDLLRHVVKGDVQIALD
jgi:hypothetical protein